MATTSRLTLYRASDWTVQIDVVTEDGGSTPQDMTGYALAFVIRRRTDGALVCSKTTSAGITIGNGAGTGDRATITITDADILHQPGTNYYGALWRTDEGSDTPYWAGPVTIAQAAPQP